MSDNVIYGSVADVRQFIRLYSDELTDDEIQSYLLRASNLINDTHGLTTSDYFIVWAGGDGVVNRYYQLYFFPFSGFTPKVYRNNVLLVSGSDYSLSGRELTVLDSTVLVVGDRLSVVYTPDLYNDYAVVLASKMILLGVSVFSGDNALLPAVIKNIDEEVSRYAKIIDSHPVNALWRDHYDKGGVF